MKNLLLTIAITAILLSTTQAQVQSLVNFNNTDDLLTLFNPDATPVFTNISNSGIANTGSINIPLGSFDIWTTKSGYSVSGEGDVYTLSAFFKIKANDGYGGLGFSSNDTNEPDGYGSPIYGLGMAFHGGGGMFINNRVQTAVDWYGVSGDLLIGNWYKMILTVTANGSNLFDMNFQIWNSDADGVLGTKFTEWTLNDVSNTQFGSATTLHVYFSAAGSRMEKIDDFEINLEGGAVIIEEGEPVLTTDAVTSITATTATCGGNVTDDRGSSITVRGVCWNTITEPTTLGANTSDGTGTGVFTSSLTNLQPSTTYYVRAYATNGVGTSFGAEVSFTTSFGELLPVGAGTIGDPYQIATLANLYWISQNSTEWSKYYIQTANINASSTSTWNGGAGWSPIGNISPYFTGNYNGNGHTIDGLFINRFESGMSFFGTAINGTISNLGITNANITGGHNSGALAGSNGATITNCYSTGTITVSQYTGGLIGSGSNVSRSYSSCNVTGIASTGGLLGYGYGTISNCYSTGNVTRKTGYGSIDIGSFIGLTGSGTIQYCYSTGSVIYTDATNPTANGFVGTNGSVSYTANFFDQTTSGQTSGTGATAKTTTQMKTQSTFTGWDIAVWNMDAGFNSGYPYLDWQNPGGTAMPAELSSFSATIAGSKVNLSWSTATEVNNYGFDIERKVSSGQSSVSNFEKIGFVNGNGNSNSTKNYSYEDNNVPTGKFSYRLKQIDNDGQFEYSKTIEVEMNGVTKFELSQNYPNPFNPTTSIRYAIDSRQFVSLKVYNLLGKEVATLVNEYREAGSYEINFSASSANGGLSSGVYIYKLQAGSFTQTKKMTLVK
jgi:hypothetical protein